MFGFKIIRRQRFKELLNTEQEIKHYLTRISELNTENSALCQKQESHNNEINHYKKEIERLEKYYNDVQNQNRELINWVKKILDRYGIESKQINDLSPILYKIQEYNSTASSIQEPKELKEYVIPGIKFVSD